MKNLPIKIRLRQKIRNTEMKKGDVFMVTILLTDGEFTGMIRALRERPDVRIIGFLFSQDTAHRTMLDRAYVAPSWDDPEYIPFLYEVIKKESVDLIFPVVTKSLPLMALHAEEIYEKTGAVVVTAPYPVIKTANHKAALFSRLKEDPLTAEYITDFRVTRTIGDLKKELKIPFVVKPVVGENKEGFLLGVSDEKWHQAFLKGQSGRLLCPGLLELMKDEESFLEERLIMPYLPGQEWDADLLVIEGKIVSATIRKNLQMFDGLSACTETSEDQKVLKACEKIVQVLGLKYLNCISFKETEEGDLKLLEINPRAMGSIYVSALGKNNLVTRLLSILLREKDEPGFRLTHSGLRTALYYDIIPLSSGGEE